VVRLSRPNRHNGVYFALLARFPEKIFDLSSLVSTQRQTGQVIALEPDFATDQS
jgi:hypothetical protein